MNDETEVTIANLSRSTWNIWRLPETKEEPLTCEVCDYVDQTAALTAVSKRDDGVIRCYYCEKKRQKRAKK